MGCSRTRKDRLDNSANKTGTTQAPTLPSNESTKTEPSWATDKTCFTLRNRKPKKSPGSTLDTEDSFRDDNSAHHNAPDDVAAACRLAMAEVRVRLPLGAFRVPNESVRQHTSRDVSQRHGSFRARRQDVGKPGIPRVSGARDRRFKSGHPDFDCGGTRVGTSRRLLTALTQVRFLPPQLCNTEGQANWRWQPPRKRSSDEPWGFDSLTFRFVRPWPTGKGAGLPSWQAGSIPAGRSENVIGDRSAAGRLALNQKTEVRPLLPEPFPVEPCLAG